MNNPSQKCEDNCHCHGCECDKIYGLPCTTRTQSCEHCKKSESPATPKLSNSCKHKWKYKKVNGMAIRQCIKCDHSSRGITCYQSKSSELGKPTQPVGGVSENKPSTGEDWWEELKRDCKILQKYGEDTDYIIENTVIPFFRSMLQKERERCAKICEETKMEEPHLSKTDRGYLWNRALDEAKQQILKDN